MITNGVTQRELTVEDWHRLNGLLATASKLEPRPRVLQIAAAAPDIGGIREDSAVPSLRLT